MEFNIDEDFVAEVTRLSSSWRKFYRDRGAAKKTLANFFKFDEKKKLREVGSGGHAHKSLKPLWRDLVLDIMHYFTLEGRFSIVYSYHFMLLNHLCHKVLVSFPFYLLLSMENSIENHRKNPKKVILHEGLMNLMFSHIKLKLIPISPKTLDCKKGIKNSGYETGDSAMEWEGNSKDEDSNFVEMSVEDGESEEGSEASEAWSKGYEMYINLKDALVQYGKKRTKGKNKCPRKENPFDKRKEEMSKVVEDPISGVKPPPSPGKVGVVESSSVAGAQGLGNVRIVVM